MELLDYLPDRHKANIIGQTQVALQEIVTAEESAWDDILLQMWPDTATWGLTQWEKAAGLETPNASTEVRKSRILAKLRGYGSVTKDMLQNVALSYYQGDIDVTEVPRESKVIITFVNQIGQPPGVETLKAALAEIIPAHLLLEYIWQYRTWNELTGMTWSYLATKTWNEIKEGDI